LHQKRDEIILRNKSDGAAMARYVYNVYPRERSGCRRRQLSCAAKDWWQQRMREKSERINEEREVVTVNATKQNPKFIRSK
jgi:hypothetical protein